MLEGVLMNLLCLLLLPARRLGLRDPLLHLGDGLPAAVCVAAADEERLARGHVAVDHAENALVLGRADAQRLPAAGRRVGLRVELENVDAFQRAIPRVDLSLFIRPSGGLVRSVFLP